MQYNSSRHIGDKKYTDGVGAVTGGTERVRFSMRSLGLFSELIILAALWPWGRHSL